MKSPKSEHAAGAPTWGRLAARPGLDTPGRLQTGPPGCPPLLTCLLTAALCLCAHAQTLSLDWWTVNGGGGTSVSTDGRFALSGTAGQPDAGSLAGGNFFLQGGFWNSAAAPVPSLWIVRLPNGDIEVSWPLWADDYLLEHAPTVTSSPDRWDDVSPATYQTDGTRFYITVAASSDAQFYRLHQVCLGP
jgi:hypothetical protein